MKKCLRSLSVAVLLCALLSACATTRLETKPDIGIEVATLPKIPLLSPVTAAGAFSANQIINVTHDGQSHQFESLLEWDKSSIHLAIVKFGKRIMTVNFDGAQVDVQKEPFVPNALQGEQILGDIQLVYWPTDALKRFMPPDYNIDDSQDIRILSYKGKPIYRIQYHADSDFAAPRENNVRLSHLLYGYEMTIQSIPN